MSQTAQAMTIHSETALANPVMPLEGVREMVSYVQTVTREIMIEGEDYGEIPGVKNKILMLPGAQKLGLAFQLRPEYEEKVTEYPGDTRTVHRLYEFKVILIHRGSGQPVGEGVGSCSTMESKYRYRWDSTGRSVPQAYWDARDSELLGGPQFKPRKTGGKWTIFQQVEHSDPADYFNTARKMAKKRAYVDAMITATACSHLFTQDMEEDTPAPPRKPPLTVQETASMVEEKMEHYPAAKQYEDVSTAPPPPSIDQWQPSEAQRKRAYAIAKSTGTKNPNGIIREWQRKSGCMDASGEPSWSKVSRDQYEQLCDVYLPGLKDEAMAANNEMQRNSAFDDDIPF